MPWPEQAQRRQWLGGAWRSACGLGLLGAAWPLPAAADAALAEAIRGGAVLLLRHAQTEAGLGDPPGMRLSDCSTQRNLSDAGRAQSRALGAWWRAQGLPPPKVLSSQWCRCLDTARLAFGQAEPWTALNSTFAGQGQPEVQRQQVLERLRQRSAQPQVWVTHQVIMTAVTGEYPAMGEGFAVDARARLQARAIIAA